MSIPPVLLPPVARPPDAGAARPPVDVPPVFDVPAPPTPLFGVSGVSFDDLQPGLDSQRGAKRVRV